MEEEIPEHTVCFILRSAPLDLKAIASATEADSLLQEVIQEIEKSWLSPRAKRLQPYYTIRHELTIKHGNNDQTGNRIITKGDLVVIPPALRKQLMTQLHEGHAGTAKMKASLRAYAYWPGFSNDVNEFVRHCSPCTQFQNRDDRPPLTPVAEQETDPFSKISLDLTGPSSTLRGNTLLTVIDYYSRYPEVFVVKHGNSREIIDCLNITFSKFGLPRFVVTDGGTPFVSKEFESYISSLGITHLRSAAYYPQANGVVERFHNSLKTRLKKIFADHGSRISLSTALQKVLYDLRSEPHAITGTSPFERMFGRPMRTKLTLLGNSPKGAASSPRDVRQEYARKYKPRTVNYCPGQTVFFRKLRGEPYSHRGTVKEKVGQHSYKISTQGGYDRIYNQTNLKPRFENSIDEDEACRMDAYEQVVDSERGEGVAEATEYSTPPLQPPPRKHRYNLRSREVNPRLYRS